MVRRTLASMNGAHDNAEHLSRLQLMLWFHGMKPPRGLNLAAGSERSRYTMIEHSGCGKCQKSMLTRASAIKISNFSYLMGHSSILFSSDVAYGVGIAIHSLD